MERRARSHRRIPNPLLNEVRSFSGFMRGERIGHFMCYRSRLERDALAILEFDPAVVRILRNDLTDLECDGLEVVREYDNYRVSTAEGSYTPDLRVTLVDRTAFVEVGGVAAKSSGRAREKLLAARAVIEHDGYAFAILTEREIRSGHRAQNCSLLLAHLRQPHASAEDEAAVARLFTQDTTVAAAAQALGTKTHVDERSAFAIAWHHLARAAHAGRLVFDLDGETLDAREVLSVLPEEPVIAQSA